MITKPWMHRLFHSFCYYIVWLSCLYSAGKGHSSIGVGISVIFLTAQIVWQYRVAHDTRDLWKFILLMTFSGLLVDSALIWLHVIYYPDNIFNPYLGPPWITVQWFELAVIAHATLARLWSQPIYTGLLALLGFTFSYRGGVGFGAVVLNYGMWSAGIVGLVWMFLLPLLFLNHDREVKKC
jgi:hypothetical protein